MVVLGTEGLSQKWSEVATYGGSGLSFPLDAWLQKGLLLPARQGMKFECGHIKTHLDVCGSMVGAVLSADESQVSMSL